MARRDVHLLSGTVALLLAQAATDVEVLMVAASLAERGPPLVDA